MHNNRITELLELLEMSIKYEKDRKNLDAYISKANEVLAPTIGYRKCNGCAQLMKRYHNDFQKAIWSAIIKEDATYAPELPKFNTAKYTSDYGIKTLQILSFEDLRNSEVNCRDAALVARKRKNIIEEQNNIADESLIRAYRLTKLAYFEEFLPQLESKMAQVQAEQVQEETESTNKERRDRSIDKQLLLQMKEEGRTNIFCAAHFGVSKAAISLMLKELGWKRK